MTNYINSAVGAKVIAPSVATTHATTTGGFYLASAGNVVITLVSGDILSTTLEAGYHPMQTTFCNSVGWTAGAFIGLYATGSAG